MSVPGDLRLYFQGLAAFEFELELESMCILLEKQSHRAYSAEQSPEPSPAPQSQALATLSAPFLHHVSLYFYTLTFVFLNWLLRIIYWFPSIENKVLGLLHPMPSLTLHPQIHFISTFFIIQLYHNAGSNSNYCLNYFYIIIIHKWNQ